MNWLRTLRLATGSALVALAIPAVAGAALIAAWNFDDGTASDVSGSSTAYDLTAVNGGPDLSNGFASFSGSEASAAYLELEAFGGNPTWTISLRVRSQGELDQGAFQGIFSNNTSSTADFSWQIESFDGVYQWRNEAGTFAIGTPTALGVWDEIVIRKLNNGDGDIWFNGVQVEASLGANPGGLQHFRLGTNRNSNRFWQGDVDDVQVFTTVEDPSVLFSAAIPEPSTSALMALGIAGLGITGRRRQFARIETVVAREN